MFVFERCITYHGYAQAHTSATFLCHTHTHTYTYAHMQVKALAKPKKITARNTVASNNNKKNSHEKSI